MLSNAGVKRQIDVIMATLDRVKFAWIGWVTVLQTNYNITLPHSMLQVIHSVWDNDLGWMNTDKYSGVAVCLCELFMQNI